MNIKELIEDIIKEQLNSTATQFAEFNRSFDIFLNSIISQQLPSVHRKVKVYSKPALPRAHRKIKVYEPLAINRPHRKVRTYDIVPKLNYNDNHEKVKLIVLFEHYYATSRTRAEWVKEEHRDLYARFWEVATVALASVKADKGKLIEEHRAENLFDAVGESAITNIYEQLMADGVLPDDENSAFAILGVYLKDEFQTIKDKYIYNQMLSAVPEGER